MKGKEEVVTLLCRFEERLQHYLLCIKAIPVSSWRVPFSAP